MKSVVINNFTGGLSQDPREHSTNTFYSSKGFDTVSKSNTLIPHPETEAEALTYGDITDSLVSDVARDNNGYIHCAGRTSGAVPTGTTVFSKDSATNLASTYNITASTGAGTTFRPNTLVNYLGDFYFITSSHALKKLAFPTTFSFVGTIAMSASWENEMIPKPFIHPLKKYLFASVGQYFARVDTAGSFLDLTSLVLPSSKLTSSLTDYGNYLAIATAPTYTGGRSAVYLWDMSEDRTFNEVIDWGEGSLMILENIGGVLVGVSISDANYTSLTTYVTTQKKKLTVRVYNGVTTTIVKEYEVASNISLRNFKAQVNGRLYFGCDNDDSLYVVYKNNSGQIVVSKDRFMANGTVVTTLRGFNIIGDYLFIGYDTAGTTGNFYRTKVTPAYGFSNILETNINPSMPIEDRSKLKKLVSVSVAKTTDTGTISLQFSADGGGTYYTVATAASGRVNKMTNNYLGEPFEEGYEFQFKVLSDTGAGITELKYAYEIMNELL